MVTLRQGNREDACFIARMILMALHIELEGRELFVRHMTELVLDEGTLYHWSRTVIAMDEEVPIGICVAYDGEDYHDRRVRSFSFVCSDGKPVAEGDSSALMNQPDESGRGEFYVDSLAVLPEYRGKGIGRRLLTDALQRGNAKGLTPTILVLPDNKSAVKLYESVGFHGREMITVFGESYMKMKI